MANNSDRDSLRAMKRSGVLTRIGAWAATAAAIVTVVFTVVPPLWGLIIADDIERIEADLRQCRSDVKSLAKLQQAALRATEVHLTESEGDTRAAIRILAAEVRLRHGVKVDDDFLPSSRAPRENRRQRLRKIKNATDRMLLNKPNDSQRHRSGGLLDDMRRQGAPVQMIEGGN